ncbi:hypothetical protein RQP46_008484 [Phenoliferia psychrophenolica]
MWAERETPEIQELEPAQLHGSIWRHDAPDSMGEDTYIHGRIAPEPPTGHDRGPTPSDGHSSSDVHDDADSASATGLRGAGASMGRNVRSRNQSGAGDYREGAASRASVLEGTEGDDKDDFAQPIGFLAAMGTTRAKKPIYTSRKFLICCPIIAILLAVIGIVLLVFPILRAIAIHTLHTAVLSVSASNITSPTNDSFGLTLEGQAHKVGIFPARLLFQEPVDVFWIAPEHLDHEMHIGQFSLDYIGVAAGHGRIKQKTHFKILDQAGFGRFAEFLITQEEFTWRLKSNNVKAKAFGFISASGLSFVKDLTLPGMQNMTNVGIADFQLPGNDPAGGVTLAATTSLTNPSAFGIEIGTLSVDLYYEDLYLGPAQTAHPINLTAGHNNIALVGRLLPHTDDPAALAQLSTVFSNYLNGLPTPTKARGRSVSLPNGEVVGWLSQGIQALTLNVNLQSPTGPIRPINAITIEALSLAFDPSAPYAPQANSSQVSASFALPFGFSLDIVELATQFEIINRRTAVAGLSSPFGMSKTTITHQNAGGTSGGITLDLPLAPLTIGPTYPEHLAFDQFTFDLTTTNGSIFMLQGKATAVTNTPLGQVKLTDIDFLLPAGLIGLESLSKDPTTILSVDVVGGTTEAILLAINVGLTNPSNLDLTAGNVTFQLFDGESFLGTAVIPDLHLVQGYQEHPSISYFQANANAAASKVLTSFTSGIDTPLTISGFNGSTAVESLTQAFMAIHLNTTLKGLQSKLLNYANLTVLPSTGVENNIANSIVSLQNPFSAELRISNIQANITHSSGLFVGSIVADTNFVATGHPPDLFSLLRVLAVEAGLSTAQLDGVVQLGGYTYTPTNGTTSKQRLEQSLIAEGEAIPLALGYEGFVSETLSKRELQKRNIYTGFELPSFVLSAFAGLKVNVDLLSVLHIGDFTTDLAYLQSDVPAYTDSSLILLLPILARPIVQKIVDEAVLSVTTVVIKDPTETCPFDGVISFSQGLTVAWNGKPLGQIGMPNVALVGDVGAQLDIEASFAVANLDQLTEFTGYLLTEPSFVWQIYGIELSVAALGITVTGISISKNVLLDGMNGFKGGVTVESFDLPANAPEGGVALTLQTSLANPSSVGISLSNIAFDVSFGNTGIGPAASTGPVVLLPKATSSLPLAGRLIPQTTPQGLQDVSTIFNGFIHGLPSDLVVRGVAAGPPSCSWLNSGIKKLAIAVILPAMKLDVINAIAIHDMTLLFTKEKPWAPSFSTKDTVAAFQLPFAFPVNIVQAATSITASSGGASRLAKRATGDFATLNVPLAPSTTDVQARALHLQFNNVPFQSTNNGIFGSFLTATTVGGTGGLGLHGSADAITSTAIGDLSLVGIAFTVQTAVEGLQGLNTQPTTVSDLDVFHGFRDYLQINANAHLFNPSNQITIGVGDVAFGLTFRGDQIGTANIANLLLVPGANEVPTAVHFQPNSAAEHASGQLLLENFVQGVASDTIIVGTSSTTDIASLKDALATIRLATTIPPLHQNLVTQVNLKIPLDIAETGIAQATIVLENPFTAAITIQSKIVTNASYHGINLGQVNQANLNPAISAPGHTTITSPSLPLALNTDPKVLIQFIEAAATDQGVDLGGLLPEFAYVLGLASTESTITTQVNQEPETCTPTGSTARDQALILAALKNLKTNLTIQSVVRLDDYQTPLNFVQNNVPTILDATALYLTGILGKSIVSNIVDGAQLSFSSGFVNNVTDKGFTVDLVGSLLNVGPLDALIEFPEGVKVFWQGNHIADISLPPICSAGGAGVPDLRTTGYLTIKDETHFEDFATYLLMNPAFTWTITTDKLRVFALGTIFENVLITKDITFDAFNKLAPGVTVLNPDFPGDASNGILLALDSLIPSPSSLGIVLGDVSFIASYDGSVCGYLHAKDLTLQAKSVTREPLTGVVAYRDDAKGLTSLGTVFSNFLQGKNTTLQVTGESVVSPAQPNSPVKWLTVAFKRFSFDTILPGHKYDVINAISLKDLTVTLNEAPQDFHALITNNETDITFKNPFKFSLEALSAGGGFIINYNNVDSALITLPMADVVSSGTSTGDNAPIVINFQTPTVLTSLNDGGYSNFFDQITNTASVDFTLHGNADVGSKTKAGNIPISGIPFSVTSTLVGVNGLGGKAVVPKTPIVIGSGSGNEFSPGPGGQFIRITLSFDAVNPAPLILHTNLVALLISYRGYVVGRAYINPLDLALGANNLPAEFHYEPADPGNVVAQSLLTAYLETNGSIPLLATGDLASSPYGALAPALSHLHLDTTIPGLGLPLVHDIVIYIDLITALCTNEVAITFRINNALQSPFTILAVSGKGSQDGTEYATFDYKFQNPLVTQAGQSPGDYSEMITPTKLIRGTIPSLPLLTAANEAKGLDIDITASAVVDQYHVPALVYSQKGVPYTASFTAGPGAPLDLASLGADPLGALGGLLTSLGELTQCVAGGGALSVLPALLGDSPS